MQQIELDVHKGRLILMAADRYDDLTKTIEEAVQNALDKKASNIQIAIDYRKRNVTIRDNGEGVSVSEFSNVILKSIGESQKKSGTSLGQFGIGLVSPLGKCEYFTFTSCPAPLNSGYAEWKLDSESIAQQAKDVTIPLVRRHDLAFVPPGQLAPANHSSQKKVQCWWRTQVEMVNLKADKIMTTVDPEILKYNIRNKFQTVMLRNKTTVSIKLFDENGVEKRLSFEGDSFSGTALPEVVYNLDSVGKVVIKMFLTSKKNREARAKKQNVHITFGKIDNDYRIVFANFLKSVNHKANNGHGLSPEKATIEALHSGLFEGEILGENVSIPAERTFFEANDALMGLYIAMDQWYAEHGHEYYHKAKFEQKDERYQQLGAQSLTLLSGLLQRPECEHLMKAVNSIAKLGTIGTGHAAPSNRTVGPAKTTTALAIRPDTAGRKGGSNKENGNSKVEEPKERKSHIPFTVQGPKGQHRKTVKSNSIGLELAYDPHTDSKELWELDRTTGVLTFNTTHPYWVAVDKNDTMVRQLQEFTVLQALSIEDVWDTDSYGLVKAHSDRSIMMEVQLMIAHHQKLSEAAKAARSKAKKSA